MPPITSSSKVQIINISITSALEKIPACTQLNLWQEIIAFLILEHGNVVVSVACVHIPKSKDISSSLARCSCIGVCLGMFFVSICVCFCVCISLIQCMYTCSMYWPKVLEHGNVVKSVACVRIFRLAHGYCVCLCLCVCVCLSVCLSACLHVYSGAQQRR